MFANTLLYIPLFVSLLSTGIRAADLIRHEALHELPGGWSLHSRAQRDDTVRLSVALRQHGLEALKERLAVVSDPHHADYGKHMTIAQIRAFSTVSDETSDRIVSWLEEGGVETIEQSDAWVHFSTTVDKAESILNCTFSRYAFEGNNPVLRTESYSIPSDLQLEIDFVYPTTQFLHASKNKRVPAIKHVLPRQDMPLNCRAQIVPDCLAAFYNLTYSFSDVNSPSRLGIASFLEQWANQKDLADFVDKYGAYRNHTQYNTDYAVKLVNNGTNPVNGTVGIEAMLDLQYSMSFTGPIPVTFYSTGGRPPALDENGQPESDNGNEPYVEWLEYLLRQESIPQVLSISYTDEEQTVPEAYSRRVCDLFAQVAARGVTILVASGDGGAAGTGRGSECRSNDGQNRRIFLPTFPASCPYVTAVGATAIYNPLEGADYSSGGFSNYFVRPSWQNSQINGYIQGLNGTHDGWYNTSGRGIPDISIIGSRFVVRASGDERPFTGTSASTPVFAAMIALINDRRLRSGKAALGWLNPLLYSEEVQSALTDVTSGSSRSCIVGNEFEPGWDAAPGWDAITGLGVPDFNRLLDVMGQA